LLDDDGLKKDKETSGRKKEYVMVDGDEENGSRHEKGRI
jgi:hypothetical protein